MTTIRTYWDDDVDGIIIGDVTFPYQFWVEEKRLEYQNKTGIPWRKVAEGFLRMMKKQQNGFRKITQKNTDTVRKCAALTKLARAVSRNTKRSNRPNRAERE